MRLVFLQDWLMEALRCQKFVKLYHQKMSTMHSLVHDLTLVISLYRRWGDCLLQKSPVFSIDYFHPHNSVPYRAPSMCSINNCHTSHRKKAMSSIPQLSLLTQTPQYKNMTLHSLIGSKTLFQSLPPHLLFSNVATRMLTIPQRLYSPWFSNSHSPSFLCCHYLPKKPNLIILCAHTYTHAHTPH